MTEHSLYVVDAFASRLFEGNPAAVVVVAEWPVGSLMQLMAREHSLSETAFIRLRGDNWQIRWFSPVQEVPFCGHATLAAAHAVIGELGLAETVTFDSMMGPLSVARLSMGVYSLDMPVVDVEPFSGELPSWIPCTQTVFSSFENIFVRLSSEQAVRDYQPNLSEISSLHPFGFAITARGSNVDFVSRYFAPSYGIPEDPVTGSIHASLAPYWSRELQKQTLHAAQLSARGGHVRCSVVGDRVVIEGEAVTYLRATISL